MIALFMTDMQNQTIFLKLSNKETTKELDVLSNNSLWLESQFIISKAVIFRNNNVL